MNGPAWVAVLTMIVSLVYGVVALSTHMESALTVGYVATVVALSMIHARLLFRRHG